MYTKLFEKYIDLSAPKHRFIIKKLKEIKDFDEALELVAKNMVLTDYVIAKLRKDSASFDEEEAKRIAEDKEKQLDAIEDAKAKAAKVKAENKKQGSQARPQGETQY